MESSKGAWAALVNKQAKTPPKSKHAPQRARAPSGLLCSASPVWPTLY